MILIIDNYDSFTYNLVQELLVIGVEVDVVRNDELTVAEMLAREPVGILISPGPGRPDDAGACLELIAARPAQPVLGVCLGHQVLGQAFGGRVERAPQLVHGKTSEVIHEGAGIFRDLPMPFEATRYHSLTVVPETLPEELEPLAWTDDHVLMGMRHRRLPYWGVQFHPESILTTAGPTLLRNFVEECRGG